MDTEFHGRISEVQGEFLLGISELLAEFCRMISAPEGPSVTLPNKVMQEREEWRVVSASVQRRKVLRAPHREEMRKPFCVLGVTKGAERGGRR
ncbi:hypothetical protein E2C01_094026 [Portunus trituberculatus]|uniref:Uncharacterized protein n=1 Tax=Portunus trituberculatus TaxID=210409 RepID=A0A5B7K0D4_PORTR|nr:hypothetical protein [Portunus trituberculatus]